MGKILIIAAIADELQGLTQHMGHPVQHRQTDRLDVTGDLFGHPIRLLETGPGLINTTRALTEAVVDAPTSLVIQTGCAGAFEMSGLANGDIGIATLEIDAQLGIEADTDGSLDTPLPFPILEKGSVCVHNRYPVNLDLAHKAYHVVQQKIADMGVKVALGPFLSVVTVTATAQRARMYHDAYGCLMENMEGVASAHVCIHYDIPFLELRAASNRVGDRDKAAWNLPLAFERASQAVIAVIDAMSSMCCQNNCE